MRTDSNNVLAMARSTCVSLVRQGSTCARVHLAKAGSCAVDLSSDIFEAAAGLPASAQVKEVPGSAQHDKRTPTVTLEETDPLSHTTLPSTVVTTTW